MEALWVIVMIIVAIVNAVSKSKQRTEAAKKAQDRATADRTAAPRLRSQSAMVEEQRRRAEAYRRQQPQANVSSKYETPPWKRVSVEPEEAAPAPERPRPVGKRVPLPAEQLCVVVPGVAAEPMSPPVNSRLPKKAQAEASPSVPHPLLPEAGSEDWRRALVLAEILAPPKSRRGPGSRCL
ncbi:MAG: hypothetical protein IJP07_02675 [Firmicutes bacterium]|nr:hypothetical protein [Bacillota bacterium]